MTPLAYRNITVLDHPAAAVAAALVHDHPVVLLQTLDHHLVHLALRIHQALHVPVLH